MNRTLRRSLIFIVLNTIVTGELLLALKLRFYIGIMGISTPLYITVMALIVSFLIFFLSIWIARIIVLMKISLEQARPKLIAMSILLGCGLSGILTCFIFYTQLE
jgi:hypothetical protein